MKILKLILNQSNNNQLSKKISNNIMMNNSRPMRAMKSKKRTVKIIMMY